MIANMNDMAHPYRYECAQTSLNRSKKDHANVDFTLPSCSDWISSIFKDNVCSGKWFRRENSLENNDAIQNTNRDQLFNNLHFNCTPLCMLWAKNFISHETNWAFTYCHAFLKTMSTFSLSSFVFLFHNCTMKLWNLLCENFSIPLGISWLTFNVVFTI